MISTCPPTTPSEQLPHLTRRLLKGAEVFVAAKKKPDRFVGVLAKSIRLEPRPSLLKQAGSEDATRLLLRWRNANAFLYMMGDIERWRALFKHFDIAPPPGLVGSPNPENDPWHAIAVALAKRFVPGMATVYEPEKKSRNTDWKPQQQIALLLAVRDAMANKKQSARSVCMHLARRPPWQKYTGTSLYTRYKEAKASAVAFLFDRAAGLNPDLAPEVEKRMRAFAET